MSLPRLNSLDDQAKPWRVGSVASSIPELYHEYHMHINVLKWTGVIVLLSLTAAALGITSSVYKMDRMQWNSTNCIKIQEQANLNQTLCSYIKSFRLPNEYYVTVCRYGSRTLIDIRQFLHQKRIIKGISLSVRQWIYMTAIRWDITSAIPQ